MTAEDFKDRWGDHIPALMGARHHYAVLCPLVEKPDGLHLLFEMRAAALGRQPNEVCFPGGRAEAGESAVECALRETQEELAIPQSHITVLGQSDFICSQAGFLLQPVIGLVDAAGYALLRPSPAEVAEAFTVPVTFFQNTQPEPWHYALEPVVPADFPYEAVGIPADYRWARGNVDVPVWHYAGHTIWGMTARMVRDIVTSI
ncbi:MAG: CoA pyrophosphatase [Oscillibacter sp.]|jgi:8-oxo-dGTP pyrophosphatase MutT (NUDIX family)|nr:CoA pyrophosphatase [Oscillibacter sp.]